MNREEFEQFVMNCGRDILRFCRLTAGDRETGDELYQDTMLALMEKCARLDPAQNTKSYALSVAILLWKNKKRKYANRRRLVPVDSMEQMEEDGGLDPPDDSAASTDEHLLKEDERRAVQKTVAGLPEKYRLPIQLFYAADMSVQEIADIMRIPEGERCIEYEHLKVVGPSYEGTYNTQMQFGMSVPEELWSTNEDPKEGFHEDIDRLDGAVLAVEVTFADGSKEEHHYRLNTGKIYVPTDAEGRNLWDQLTRFLTEEEERLGQTPYAYGYLMEIVD